MCIAYIHIDKVYTDISLMIAVRASASHQRSVLYPRGNEGFCFVQMGNLLASRVVCLIYYVLSRRGRYLLEQPGGSYLPWDPRVDQLFLTTSTFTASIWGGSYATDVSAS